MTGLSEAIGFGLAVAGSIDLAPKYGQQLSKRISELKRSTELTRHLRAFEIEPERRLLASRLERGRAICNDPHADPAIKEELDRTFVEMGNLLAEAVLHIHQLRLVHKNFSAANTIIMQNPLTQSGSNGAGVDFGVCDELETCQDRQRSNEDGR
ncbi:MAG: hypothetical protein LQ340_000686 [Diploschistes diacapsis]|nr:MAG: hypothetical protein LQ340_000686 [Diploschistes diacapsis]